MLRCVTTFHCSKARATSHTDVPEVHGRSLADLLKEYRRLDDAIVMRINRVRFTYRNVQTSNPASFTDKCTIP
jgi:hypothetical protein